MKTNFDLFIRHKENPIITTEDLPKELRANTVFNPGVGVLDNGKTVLLLRVEKRRDLSVLVPAFSDDGINNWKIGKTVFQGEDGEGFEDPRLIYVAKLKTWVIVYTKHCKYGPKVAIATTEDFKSFNSIGDILPSNNKDAALFPEPINGSWWMLHRAADGANNQRIWICKAPEGETIDSLKYWGDHTVLIGSDGGNQWDGKNIGLSAPPLRTDVGWLMLYHGVRKTSAGPLYRLGLALLDLNNPTKVTHRGEEYIMTPFERYEKIGDVGGAIFPCGWLLDNEIVKLYYGAADTSVCYAKAPLEVLLDFVLKCPVG